MKKFIISENILKAVLEYIEVSKSSLENKIVLSLYSNLQKLEQLPEPEPVLQTAD